MQINNPQRYFRVIKAKKKSNPKSTGKKEIFRPKTLRTN